MAEIAIERLLPEWYDELAQFEHEAKGYLLNFMVTINGKSHLFNFYDPVRFEQDVALELEESGNFEIDHLVILPTLSYSNITHYLHNYFIK